LNAARAKFELMLLEEHNVPPSLNFLELELLIGMIGVLIFVALFLALLCSAIFGLGLARLLYVSSCWCMRKIHQSNSRGGTRAMNAVGRVVPHY
jgi:hypothetical protein